MFYAAILAFFEKFIELIFIVVNTFANNILERNLSKTVIWRAIYGIIFDIFPNLFIFFDPFNFFVSFFCA